VVMAMAGYLEKSGTAAPDMKLTLELNEKVIWTRAVTPKNWALFESKTVVSAQDLVAGENKIVLRREGKGAPVYSIFLKQFRKRAQFAPSTGGLQVSREYALIANGKRVPLKSSRTLQSGDEVEVTLTVKSERSYDYLMLEDPMPSPNPEMATRVIIIQPNRRTGRARCGDATVMTAVRIETRRSGKENPPSRSTNSGKAAGIDPSNHQTKKRMTLIVATMAIAMSRRRSRRFLE